ncbi:MAG: wax ester/triacylglycerol synthase family O-acyltransferase [Actinobacteria bacterium]|nr:wax ester/triacylglycerol synthase family O-acyltransferase [Actinomycetota bacterium]
MERFNGLDTMFLNAETATMHMHVVGVMIFDPSTAPSGYSFEQVRDVVASRLDLLKPFRRRAVQVPFHLHHPLWVEDPEFDLDYHLRRACLPSPGGMSELEDFVAEVAGRPLDLNRPLWEMYVVEGMEDGKVALVTKTHHAAIDGVSGAELAASFLDLEPEPRKIDPPQHPWVPERIPSDYELAAYALVSLAFQPLTAMRAVRRTIEMITALTERNRTSSTPPPPAPFTAPRTKFNASITAHRRLALTDVSLEQVKAIKRAVGCTVNDVILALCAGALRSYLIAQDDLPEDPLVAMVPISVRTENERDALGNRLSAMLVSLPTTVQDPLQRLSILVESTSHAKEQGRAIGAETLMNWAEFAAPALAARAARLVSSIRLFDRFRPAFNVTISNIPGPNFPLYGAGAQMVAMYPLGPIVEGIGLNITVMSYMGKLFFGILGCRELVPSMELLVQGIQDSLSELRDRTAGWNSAR